ncbi:hypothetical protein [Serratia plymuthica]|uniref:hypothetical protein n=1 Tax=Serratia plymuthica TaxID=82996 RepID=UPI000F00A6A9|nr:hypothetical protein [Serratia plymuthica]
MATNYISDIVYIKSMMDLKNTTPVIEGQEIYLKEYYQNREQGGGFFTGHLSPISAIDDGGYTTVTINNSSAIWRRKDITNLSLYDGGCDPDLQDNSDRIQNIALIRGNKAVKIPAGYWNIGKPIMFPENSAISLYGENSYTSQAVFNYVGNDISNPLDPTAVINIGIGSSNMSGGGFNLSNLQIIGNSKIISGLSIKYAGYIQLKNISILYCKGAGLYLDKVQDSYFYFLEIQGCGRSNGSYNSYQDITDTSKMMLAPVHIISTMADDECNMLRFENCQWEANLISPTLYVRGGLGIWVKNLHMEHRDGPLAMLLGNNPNASIFLYMNNSGEVFLNEIQASEVKSLVYATGYGVVYVTNVNRAGDITHTASGKFFNVFLNSCWLQDINFSTSVKAMITNCRFANLRWSYPSYPSTISATQFSGVVAVNNDGSNTRIDFVDCQYTTVNCNTSNLRFFGGRCTGNFTYTSKNGLGSVIDMDIEGTANVDLLYGCSFQPGKTKYTLARTNISPQEYGNNPRPIGSEWFNTAVTGDQEGAIYSWVKTATGWRPNSRISRFGTHLSSMTFSQLPAAISCKGTVIFCTNTAASPTAQAIISDGADWVYLATPGTKATAAN